MKQDKTNPIPRATAKRLSLYYRIFKRFNAEKIERANSKQIAEAIGIDSATVRRDFSYFGELGRRGFEMCIRDSSRVDGNFSQAFSIWIDVNRTVSKHVTFRTTNHEEGT